MITWRKIFHPIRHGCPDSPDGLHSFRYEKSGHYRVQPDGTFIVDYFCGTRCCHCGQPRGEFEQKNYNAGPEGRLPKPE